VIELTLSDNLTARLQAGAKASADFSVPMAAIADLMRSETVLNFETERGPDGTPWLPSQRAIADGGLTLTDTGQLRQSITAASDDSSAIIGTNLVYAAIHQDGGTIRAKGAAAGGKKALKTPFGPRGSVTMPARPFVGFGPPLVADIEAILVAHLDGAMN
jgi:phage virion morphogenesis protein